jgi:type II secretory pathway component PulK
MGRFRSVADLKAAHDLLEQTIGFRYALVLSKMLEPGVSQKGLDEAAVLRGIFKYSPVISTVPTPFACARRERV